MLILKRVIKSFAGFLLNLSLIALLLTYFLSSLTSYESFKQIIGFVIAQQYKNIDVASMLQQAKTYCQINQSFEFSLMENVTIRCDEINYLSEENVTYYITDKISQNLYENGACSIVECDNTQKQILDLFTKKGNQKIKKYFSYSLLATMFFALILILVTEGLGNKFKTLGIVLISATLPILAINFFVDYLAKAMGLSLPQGSEELINILLADSLKLPFYVLIMGVILVIVGFVLKRKS